MNKDKRNKGKFEKIEEEKMWKVVCFNGKMKRRMKREKIHHQQPSHSTNPTAFTTCMPVEATQSQHPMTEGGYERPGWGQNPRLVGHKRPGLIGRNCWCQHDVDCCACLFRAYCSQDGGGGWIGR